MNKRKFKLEVTAGYKVKFEQISRIIESFASINLKNSKKYSRQLGISKRQFGMLASLCASFGLVGSRKFSLTKLGKYVVEHDLFFDKIETLNLIHYIISSEPRFFVWNRVINRVLYKEKVTSPETARKYFRDLKGTYSEKSMQNNLPKEISAVLTAYVESKFSKLNILEKISKGSYKLNKIKIPDFLSFLYALIHYRDKFFGNATGLEIDTIIEKENSPGKVFFMKDFQVINLLDRLHDKDLIRKETFGDLNQIRFKRKYNKQYILSKIYGENDD